MGKKLRVAAYCRVSTDKEEQVNSLESQRNYFKTYIENREEWVLTGIYYDEGLSGTQTRKRQGFNQMMEEAFCGNLDLILTKEVSRFARNTVDTLSFTRRLKDCGVGVIFTIDHIDTREADGELRLTLMASIAQEESRKTSERVKWGQRRKMEQGVVFGRDLLGYTVKNGTLMRKEEEVPVVQAIFHKYTNEGKGTRVIARELEEEGIKPKRGDTWSNTVILRVLKNEKYVGDLCQKKTWTPNYLTHQKQYNRGEEDFIRLSNHHEPIIDRSLWERTQKELEERSQKQDKKKKYSNRYWCSGKLECGLCGRHYTGRNRTYKDGTGYQTWRCLEQAVHGREKTDAAGKKTGCENQAYFDQTLCMVIRSCIGCLAIKTEDWIKETEDERKDFSGTEKEEKERKRLEKEIEDLAENKRKVIDWMVKGVILMQEGEDQLEWYDRKIEKLEKQRELYQEKESSGKKQEEKKEYPFIFEKRRKGEKDSGCWFPKQLYREILEKIVLYPEGKMIVYLKGLTFGIQVRIQRTGNRKKKETKILEIKKV